MTNLLENFIISPVAPKPRQKFREEALRKILKAFQKKSARKKES